MPVWSMFRVPVRVRMMNNEPQSLVDRDLLRDTTALMSGDRIGMSRDGCVMLWLLMIMSKAQSLSVL